MFLIFLSQKKHATARRIKAPHDSVHILSGTTYAPTGGGSEFIINQAITQRLTIAGQKSRNWCELHVTVVFHSCSKVLGLQK